MKDSNALISVHSKTGFLCNDKEPVLILDEAGKVFYHYKPKNGKFNLPAGRYYTDNKLQKLDKPLNFKLPKLPKPDRNFTPERLNLHFDKNNNTASIYPKTGKIVIDSRKAAEFTRPQLDFVLLHEVGHLKYNDEDSCDIFATVEMLKRGYNPSQIFTAIAGTLRNNPDNKERCEIVLEALQESEK